MANPNLKAQIEAAKSALARGELVTTVTSVANPITDEPTAEHTNQQILSQEPIAASTLNSKIQSNKKTFVKDAAGIDARITSLEKKLLASQQDLHELLSKIRKITDSQSNIKQKSSKSKITVGDSGFRRYLNRVSISLFAIIFLLFCIFFFLTSKQNLLQFPLWINQLSDFIRRWIG